MHQTGVRQERSKASIGTWQQSAETGTVKWRAVFRRVRYVCQIAVRYRSRDTVCVSDKCLRWLRKDAVGSLKYESMYAVCVRQRSQTRHARQVSHRCHIRKLKTLVP